MIFFIIHHFPYYIVDFRSANWLPYEYWSVANTDTRSAPIFWVARVFFSYGALLRFVLNK